MADPTDKTPDEQDRLTELKSIREVMAAVQAEQMSEIKAQRAEVQQKKREGRDKRAKMRRDKDTSRRKDAQVARTAALRLSTEQVSSQMAVASRALRAARRAATEFPFPRGSPEGQEAQRMARDIEAVIGATRRVGRGTFYEGDPDLDVEVEADTN
jgi:hypothetical protein